MNRCVPSWNQNDNSNRDVSTLDYEVAELTWENGQLTMHGLGPRRSAVAKKPQSTTSTLTKCTWNKPHTTETLEAIVNQASLLPHHKTHPNDLQVPWLNHHKLATVAADVDALVPGTSEPPPGQGLLSGATGVASCSGGPSVFENRRVARAAAAAHEWSSGRDQSRSGSGTFGIESSRQLTSTGSPENTSSGKHSPDEHDSVCHSRPQKEASEVEESKKGKTKSSNSTKRSRIAAIHNQSERKRRDKINQRMKTLQKLIPNSNKTDKASMLDEVIEYLKQMQAQVHMMSRMNMSPMMMNPMAMQMSMMNPMGMGMAGMGMGMGMAGMGMDMNTVGRSGLPAAGFHPSVFMQMPSWEGHAVAADHRYPSQSQQQQQSMAMDAYSRMAALFQQMQNQPCGPLPNN